MLQIKSYWFIAEYIEAMSHEFLHISYRKNEAGIKIRKCWQSFWNILNEEKKVNLSKSSRLENMKGKVRKMKQW